MACNLEICQAALIGMKARWVSLADLLPFFAFCADHFPTKQPFQFIGNYFFNPGRPLAFGMLYTPEIVGYAAESEKSLISYCNKNNYTAYIYRLSSYDGIHPTWHKARVLLNHMGDHRGMLWIDADMLISREFRLPQGDDVIVYNDPGAWHFNAGFITFRNSENTIAFLHAVIARCEALDDRSSLYVNGSDQTQFIQEYLVHFPDSLPRSNLVANIPTVLDKLREPGPGLWHFMGLNPPSIRAIVMDYYAKSIVNGGCF